MTPTPQPVAAIDCGTNSTRLLIVDGDGRTLIRLMRITRLGDGVDATHKLNDDAIGRTLRVLGEFRVAMDDNGVAWSRMVATSAVRDAVNGDEMLDRASEAAAVQAELLSGEEEGRLAFLGATADLPPTEGDDVVVDIGGGSTELVAVAEGQVEAVSLDLGCVRLSERYLPDDPPLPEQLVAVVAAIDAALHEAPRAVTALRRLRPRSRLVGLAGTVSTLAALDQQLAHYDYSRLHHATLTRQSVVQWCDVLAAEPARSRLARPGMSQGREDVIVGGSLVLREVMSRFRFEECIVSESDILDGLVAGLLGAT
jgi:exopolyphosphatase/guanosine-5'-triphosphate,3'-diphosphate pyrophosphatase